MRQHSLRFCYQIPHVARARVACVARAYVARVACVARALAKAFSKLESACTVNLQTEWDLEHRGGRRVDECNGSDAG